MAKIQKRALSGLISAVLAVYLALIYPVAVFAQSTTEDTTSSTSTEQTPPPADEGTTAPAEEQPAPTPTPEPQPEPTPTSEQTPTAESTAPAPVESTKPKPPKSTTPGPNRPGGADANTYSYNSTTGLWENDYYTWDPVTKQKSPKTEQAYSYNPATGKWETTTWQYNAAKSTYEPFITSVDSKPEGAKVVTTEEQARILRTAQDQASAGSSLLADSNQSGDANLLQSLFNLGVSNDIISTALSGDALVSANTLAGNAVSGTAAAMVNIINILRSTWSFTGDLTTFVADIYGNVFGDLFIDPGQIQAAHDSQGTNNLQINSDTNALIDNKLTIDAASGDATVRGNTEAGSATSGDAHAVANVVNAINSSIAAKQSFIGMMNIYGNLDGDILLPPGVLEQLIASNTLSTLDISQIENSSLLAELNTNQNINNNVNLSATTGNASVDNNTSAGNATTGNANTNLTVLNLTGKQVIGKDALLVFVNVLGKWVGVITNAPNGSTAAALGGGLTENTQLSTDTSITDNTNSTINNDISLNAASGDASVESNTKAGDATSGNATASASILNINLSQLALSDWFGILFINVFGSWNGSFGVDTIAGEPLPTASASNGGPAVQGMKVFRFIPGNSENSSKIESVPIENSQLAAASEEAATGTLAAATGSIPSGGNGNTTSSTSSKPPAFSNWLFTIIGSAIGFSLLGAERYLHFRERRQLGL